jgi:hypothetical protein
LDIYIYIMIGRERERERERETGKDCGEGIGRGGEERESRHQKGGRKGLGASIHIQL